MRKFIALTFFIFIVGLQIYFFFLSYQQYHLVTWITLFGSLITFLSISIWYVLRVFVEDRPATNLTRTRNTIREIHLQRHDHTDSEVTRYRDLVWKIGALTWGTYYGLFWVNYNKESSPLYHHLPNELFLFLFYSVAICSTILYLFCERSTNLNRYQRRTLGLALGLRDQWNFKEGSERAWRFGFIVPVTIFILSIWVPFLLVLYCLQTNKETSFFSFAYSNLPGIMIDSDLLIKWLIFLALLLALFLYQLPNLMRLIRESQKHIFRILIHIFIFIFTTGLAVYIAAFSPKTTFEEFSLKKGNIVFEGKSENIVLHPERKVVKALDLKIKDTFAHWQYEVDYFVRKDNSVFLKFIYGENKTDNRRLAERGLMFTYRTRALIFEPVVQFILKHFF